MKTLLLTTLISATTTLLSSCQNTGKSILTNQSYVDSLKIAMQDSCVKKIFLGFDVAHDYLEIMHQLDSLQCRDIIRNIRTTKWYPELYHDIDLFEVDTTICFRTDIMFEINNQVQTEEVLCDMQIFNNQIYSLLAQFQWPCNTSEINSIHKLYKEKYGEGYSLSMYSKNKVLNNKYYHNSLFRNDPPFIRTEIKHDYNITNWIYKNIGIYLIVINEHYEIAEYNKRVFEHYEKLAKERYCNYSCSSSQCAHTQNIANCIEDNMNCISHKRDSSLSVAIAYVVNDSHKKLLNIHNREKLKIQEQKRLRQIQDSIDNANLKKIMENQQL